jgi:hypothetical protein
VPPPRAPPRHVHPARPRGPHRRGADRACVQRDVRLRAARLGAVGADHRRRSLYGVTCLQVYSYYVDYGRDDRVFLKSLVRLFFRGVCAMRPHADVDACQVAAVMCAIVRWALRIHSSHSVQDPGHGTSWPRDTHRVLVHHYPVWQLRFIGQPRLVCTLATYTIRLADCMTGV